MMDILKSEKEDEIYGRYVAVVYSTGVSMRYVCHSSSVAHNFCKKCFKMDGVYKVNLWGTVSGEIDENNIDILLRQWKK